MQLTVTVVRAHLIQYPDHDTFCYYGIVILAQHSGFFYFVPQITLTDSAESYIRKKGEVLQLSRIGDYERIQAN